MACRFERFAHRPAALRQRRRRVGQRRVAALSQRPSRPRQCAPAAATAGGSAACSATGRAANLPAAAHPPADSSRGGCAAQRPPQTCPACLRLAEIRPLMRGERRGLQGVPQHDSCSPPPFLHTPPLPLPCWVQGGLAAVILADCGVKAGEAPALPPVDREVGRRGVALLGPANLLGARCNHPCRPLSQKHRWHPLPAELPARAASASHAPPEPAGAPAAAGPAGRGWLCLAGSSPAGRAAAAGWRRRRCFMQPAAPASAAGSRRRAERCCRRGCMFR